MKKLVAASAALVAAVALVGCSSGEEEGRSVHIYVNGSQDKIVNENPGLESCSFFDGTLKSGDRVVLKGADGSMLGVGNLEAADSFREGLDDPNMTMGVCSFEVVLPDIDLSQAAYSVQIASYDEVPLSREEVTRDMLVLSMRGAFDVLRGQEEVFEVYDGGQ